MTRLAILAILCSGCATVRFTPDGTAGFRPRSEGPLRWFTYVPTTRLSDEKLPVVLYLHGGGERGEGGAAPTQTWLGEVVRESDGRFPFIVVFPQCAADRFWGEPEMEARALLALDDALAHLGGDPDRVYLTGNSLGGYGTWMIGSRHPDRFAALVPIAAGVRPPPFAPVPAALRRERPDETYARIVRPIAAAHLPVWAFHGGVDPLVPFTEGRRVAEALHAAGGEVIFTLYDGVGHESEARAYREPELWRWLAGKRRPPRDTISDPR